MPSNVHDALQARKDYTLLLSFVGQARLQFAGLHSLFLALWCTVIEIGGMMKDLLFWYLMYLYPGFIYCRRCLPHKNYICNARPAKFCSLIHQACDNILRKNIGYEFLLRLRQREIHKGQNYY